MATKKAKSTATVEQMMAEDAAEPVALHASLLDRIAEAADALRKAKQACAAAEQEMETHKATIRDLRERVLPALLDEGQVQMVALQDAQGTTVERGQEVYASISRERAPAACAWLDANGYGSLIKSEVVVEAPRGDRATATRAMAALRTAGVQFEERSGVHAQTLKAFVRESLEAGRTLPPSITYHTVAVADVKEKKARKKRTASAPRDDSQIAEF